MTTMMATPPTVAASALPLPFPHTAVAAILASTPPLFPPLLPLSSRRGYLNAGIRSSFLKLSTKSSLNTAACMFTVSSKKFSLGETQIRQGRRPDLYEHGLPVQTISYSQRQASASAICAAALGSTCSTGQTQTVERQSSKTIISLLPGMQKTPKLDDGGVSGPPREGGGGGGGGGGGSPSSGGFFLFAFLLFLKFLKDKEKEEEEKWESRPRMFDD